jgi:hypothetical protein
MAFRVVLSYQTHGPGAIIDGPAISRILPGMAVHFGARYLGRVVTVSPVGAHVLSPFDPEATTAVDVCAANGKVTRGLLRGDGSEARFESMDGPLTDQDSVLVMTRGGQEMVPSGLIISSGSVRNGTLSLHPEHPWPDGVQVSAFRFAAERQALRGRR